MSHQDLRGVLPVFQTPFTSDESIDFDQLHSEIDWIAQQGVHGVVFGMVSEALRLSDGERRAVIEVAAQAAAAYSLPCIASVGAESTKHALARADDAVNAGAVALMATPPLLGSHNDEGLYAYFSALLAHFDVPLVVQDASGYVGQVLSIELQARLFDEFGARASFKPEAVPLAPTLKALREATGGNAAVFEGMGGAALVESHAGGVAGTMPGAEVCWAVVALWNALERGDMASAHLIHTPLANMIALQNDLDSFVVCEKHLLVEQGVFVSQIARTPVSFSLTPEARGNLSSLLGELRSVVDATTAAALSTTSGTN